MKEETDENECGEVCERIPQPTQKEDIEGKKLMEIPIYDQENNKLEFGSILDKQKNYLVVFMRHT